MPKMHAKLGTFLPLALLLIGHGAHAASQPSAPVDSQSTLELQDPDARAAAILARMDDEQKQRLIVSAFSFGSAGVVRGLPEFGVPAIRETDSATGIFRWLTPYPYVSLPSVTSMAASFDPELVSQAYGMVAREARAAGMGVLLAPAMNLVRELRGGRTYEYFSEDPLVTGTLAAAAVRGVQNESVIATLKHYAVNDQESARHSSNAIIAEAQLRESDLLAFELAIQAEPGAIMCAYSLLNGVYACKNEYLLQDVLKDEWGFKGWVMTDWGAQTDTVQSALAGLDQFSAGVAEDGGPNPYMDREPDFGKPLLEAIRAGKVPASRRDDMARRILRTAFARGVVDNPPVEHPLDVDADIATARRVSEGGIVLLKNDGVLPLINGAKSIAIVGGHANTSVLTKITSLPGKPRFPFPPENDVEKAVQDKALAAMGADLTQEGEPGDPESNPARPSLWTASSPLKALQALLPESRFHYDRGTDPQAVARLARESDLVILFAYQDTNEGEDLRSLRLTRWQEAAIDAAAKNNSNLIVVLQNGTAVTMPWAGKARAIVAAWYPGSGGGEAIADILTGKVNPSGKLPISFPVDERHQPRPDIPGQPSEGSGDNQITTMSNGPGPIVDIDYRIEGADVGYKWLHRTQAPVAYPFGHGLSYTRFTYSSAKVEQRNGRTLVNFTLRNAGKRVGKEIAQVYLDAPFRLAGYAKVALQPGESRKVSIELSPRLLAGWDEKAGKWVGLSGRKRLLIGASSADIRLTAPVTLKGGPLAD